MIAFGCEDKYKTPIPEDRICPKCGREVEVFLSRGRQIEDVACECGYVLKAEEQIPKVVDRQNEDI